MKGVSMTLIQYHIHFNGHYLKYEIKSMTFAISSSYSNFDLQTKKELFYGYYYIICDDMILNSEHLFTISCAHMTNTGGTLQWRHMSIMGSRTIVKSTDCSTTCCGKH